MSTDTNAPSLADLNESVTYFEDLIARLERELKGWEAVIERKKNGPAVLAAHAWAVAPDYGPNGDGFYSGLCYTEDRKHLVLAQEGEEGGYFHRLSLWRREDAVTVAAHTSATLGQAFKIVHEQDIAELVVADKRKHLITFRGALERTRAAAAKIEAKAAAHEAPAQA
jgi:hypothetical protein